MSRAPQPQFLSVDEYLAVEAAALSKSEYVEGRVRAKSGVTLRHNQVVVNCLVHLGILLKGRVCRPYNSDTKLRIRRRSGIRFYYPDLQVVCESNPPTFHFQDSPVLVIEVLSPTTRQVDLDEKLSAYLDIPTLQCYLALEQHQPSAVVLLRSPHGFVRNRIEGVDAIIDLPFLACRLVMREIYDGVEFTPTCVQEDAEEFESASAAGLVANEDGNV